MWRSRYWWNSMKNLNTKFWEIAKIWCKIFFWRAFPASRTEKRRMNSSITAVINIDNLSVPVKPQFSRKTQHPWSSGFQFFKKTQPLSIKIRANFLPSICVSQRCFLHLQEFTLSILFFWENIMSPKLIWLPPFCGIVICSEKRMNPAVHWQ